MRTGDTPSNDRQKLIRRPPDLLITTPESLYLMLTSSARETLAGVETVIIDEIHAMATTKRGAHLTLTLERLEEVTDRPPQRIGLSATQRPLEEVAEFLGGWSEPGRQAAGADRRRRDPQTVGDRGRRPDRGHVDARPGRRSTARRARRRQHCPSGARRSGRASTPRSSSGSSRTARRSSSATPAAPPSASPPSSTSSRSRRACPAS